MKSKNSDPYKECLEEDFKSIEKTFSWNSIKAFFRRLTTSRKYRRRSVSFDQKLRVNVHFENEKIEVVPLDISEGGIGFGAPHHLVQRVQSGDFIRLEFFDQNGFCQILSGSIRYIKPSASSQSTVGVQFEKPSSSLIEYLKR